MPDELSETDATAPAQPDDGVPAPPWDDADPRAIEEELARRQRASRAWAAGLALAGILVVALGQPSEQDMAWGGAHIPSTCIFKKLTGRGCPFCGMTRATSFAIHGQLANSWRMNPIGVLVAAALVATALYFGIGALWPNAIKVPSELEGRWLNRVIVGLMILMVIRWLAVLILIR